MRLRVGDLSLVLCFWILSLVLWTV
ncbi:hypothetical protein NC652_024318 [Populus alba x Populus x berolinensis]|nr:hypothetical protein NC652_024318 [Populus alba x Populus x berolinensis]